MATSGHLIVVSGPSAVGKDTVLDEVLGAPELLSRSIRWCVTATTRDPRPGEIPGVSYHFLTVPQFQEMVQADGFLEYANVFGNWYGTPANWVAEQRAQGVDVLLKIDVQGAKTIKQRVPDAMLIFIRPPSLEELERRIRGRGTETEEQIARRLGTASQEMAQISSYDYAVVNDQIENAVADLRAILRAEHCRLV